MSHTFTFWLKPPYTFYKCSKVNNLDGDPTRIIKNFQTNDEVYHNLKIEKNSQPFLSARSNTTKEDHIVGWTCEYKKGKTVYNALGHDSESLKNPYMIDIIEKSLEWLSGDKFVKN